MEAIGPPDDRAVAVGARMAEPNEVVMSMTGHVTEEMTTLHYDRVRDQAKRAAVNAMTDRLDASATEPKTDAETADPARGDLRGDHRAPTNETAGRRRRSNRLDSLTLLEAG